MKKKIVLWVMLIMSFFSIGIIEAPTSEASAISAETMRQKFEELKKKYPEGSTWNGSYKNLSWQCMGWAETVCDYLFGENPRNWVQQTNWNNLCVGDHVRLYYRGEPNNHSIVITNMVGDTIYYADCNGNGDNKVHWNRTMSRSTLLSKALWFKSQPDNWVRTLEGSGDKTPPTITNVYASNVNGSSFTVNCTLSDNVGVTRVWLNIYGPGGHKGYAVSAASGTFSHTINTADYGGPGSYRVDIYAFDAAGNETGSSISGIQAMNDTEKPTITNAYISNISDSSFTVNCTLSDNVGVTRVWLNVYGPGGEKGYEVSASSGAFSHTINTADYGGPGKYSVHIYAFDTDKNETGYNLSGFIVASPTTPFTVTTIKSVSAVTNNTSSTQTVTIVIADYFNDILSNTTAETQTFAPNETKTYSHAANARVFVWDSLRGMKPLAN